MRALTVANLLLCSGMFVLTATGAWNALLSRWLGWPALGRIAPWYNGVFAVLLFVLAFQAFALRSESRWYVVAGAVALVLAVLFLLLLVFYPRPALIG